jgi:hypothetical protein
VSSDYPHSDGAFPEAIQQDEINVNFICVNRGDESFSLTMVLSSGADHSLLSAGQRATGRVIYPEAGARIVSRPSDARYSAELERQRA